MEEYQLEVCIRSLEENIKQLDEKEREVRLKIQQSQNYSLNSIRRRTDYYKTEKYKLNRVLEQLKNKLYELKCEKVYNEIYN